MRPAIGDAQLTRRTTNDERRTTNDERRTTNDERRTTNDERQTTLKFDKESGGCHVSRRLVVQVRGLCRVRRKQYKFSVSIPYVLLPVVLGLLASCCFSWRVRAHNEGVHTLMRHGRRIVVVRTVRLSSRSLGCFCCVLFFRQNKFARKLQLPHFRVRQQPCVAPSSYLLVCTARVS